MKKLFLFLTLIYTTAYAQKYSCCLSSVNHQNNVLAMNESFAAAHLVPESYKGEEPRGYMISFKTSDGKEGHAYVVKSGNPTSKT